VCIPSGFKRFYYCGTGLHLQEGIVMFSVAIQTAGMFIGFAALFGLVCRLNSMTWKTHKPWVISMHIGMAISCAWAIKDCIMSEVTPGSIGAILGAFSWIITSLPTWRYSPPAHTRTEPAPFDNQPIG